MPVMTAFREIELKFGATARALDRLEQGPFLKSIGAGKPTTTSLLSVYFDTGTLKLRRNHLSLRVRRNGDRRVQTIKVGNGTALIERGEWERAVPTAEPDLNAARGTALQPVLSKKVRRSLKPVFETRVTRTTYPIKTRDSLIELAIDRGEIDTGRESSTVCELELELKRGQPTDLFLLARRIAIKTPVDVTLASKAERGYRLFAGEKPAPIRSLPLALSRNACSREAFQAIARACLHQLVGNLPLLRKRDPEGLHQTRVAIRRLRAAISLFSEILNDEQTRALKKELKWITGEFGPARELYVFMRLVKAADDGPSPSLVSAQSGSQVGERTASVGMPGLRQDLREKRGRAFARARTAVGSARFRMMLLELVAWIEAGAWTRSKNPLVRAGRKRSIAALGAEELRRRWKKILKRGKKLAELVV